MIVDLPDTSTDKINKKIIGLREEGGAVTMGRVLTLVIAPDTEGMLEDSIEAANAASHEHPCRIIVVIPGDRLATEARLDAQIRVGGDAGAGEVVVLRLSGPLANHASSVVLPFLLPDTPVVAWWPDIAPRFLRRIRWASWRSGGSPMPPTVRTSGRHQVSGPGLHRRRHRSGVEPDHVLAGAADVRARSGAARAHPVRSDLRAEGRTGARCPGRLVGRPDRRPGTA